MEWVYNIDLWILGFCSLIGAVKASMEIDKGKPVTTKLIDITLGTVCGMAAVDHFANDLSLGLSVMVAVAGSSSGAMLVEVFLSVLPHIAKDIIAKKIRKFFS